MKIYVQPGEAVTVTAPRDVKSGDLLVIGALAGFCQTDALEDEQVAIVTEGVFRVEILAAGDVNAGDVIYLDGQDLTTDDGPDGENPRAGVVIVGGASDGDIAEVHLKLNA